MSGTTTLSGFVASIQNIFRVVSIIRFGNFAVQDSLYARSANSRVSVEAHSLRRRGPESS